MNGKSTEKVGEARQRPPTSNLKFSDTKRIVDHDVESKAMHSAFMAAPHVWRAALRRSGLPASALVVGLALVDEFANRKTGRCFPSFDAIAESSNLSSRSVRAGVSAVRAAGLIATRKTKFDGSLSFYLTAPRDARSDAKLSVRDTDEVTENRHTKRQKNVTRSDTDLSLNLRIEPPKVTYEDRVLPCGPPSAVANAPFDLPATPPDLTRTADVVGDGKLLIKIQEQKEEKRERCPSDNIACINFLRELAGPSINAEIIREIVDAWRNVGPMTRTELLRRITDRSRRAAA